ncbi:LysR family transcriptional regulator [Microbacterium rhizosphaerae]|uniref:LysR family transcriptional regulator n=1 Tax=Microbacterium rhizosphaerae TaxID=1678237 RepID=A0ABZ0SQW6_9MICO|nr:LysR family transcriptional regulator [Microbacterium rhizosphaerae]WPR91359.1 LysR family transcriptional regulator [Microbacterium rhizosphaerae]
MDLRQMEYFVALAEESQFTRAAEVTRVSQSGLSAAIKSLEQDLNAQLFTRTTRRVELTPAGRALFPHARNLLAEAIAGRDAVMATAGEITGSLRVGAEQCLGSINVPELVERFHRRHGEVEITFTQAGTAALLSRMREGEIDLAFVAGTPETTDPRLRLTGLDSAALATEPLVLLTHADHPLATQKSVTWDDLQDRTYIDLDVSWAIRVVTDELFARRKIPRRVAFTVGDIHALIDMIDRDLGIAVVPQSVSRKTIAAELRALHITDLRDPVWTVSAAFNHPESGAGLVADFLSLVEPRI